ncbi:FAD-binding domain-containing protein [Cadophora sp. DSE1049]|nr:FAD-binding domain-containing protein [Cadophora sp. DSE1049]
MHLPVFALLIVSVSAGIGFQRQAISSPVCLRIAGNITGNVYYNSAKSNSTSTNDTTTNPFTTAITHWMSSSSQTPLCVVEVNDTSDISAAIKIIGATKTPFAVKSAGYNSNPGFSSTMGVHISLEKIKQVNLSEDKSTVEIGMGNSFTEVYQALNGSGVNVLGARADGPGTGGVTLSGGYSWYTNQYGLGCDTVVSYELVLPCGEVRKVDASQPDLFFALKGGLNRFGIVTKIVFKTVPQPGQVYGGLQFFDPATVPALIKATESFHLNSKDPKASVILTLGGGSLPGAILLSFYDGESRPADFDVFNSFNATFSTLATQDFSSMIGGTLTSLQTGNRGSFASLSTTTLTHTLLAAVVNETNYWTQFTADRSGGLLQYDVEPFHAYGKFATDSAYPHADSPLPLNVYFSWTEEKDDAFWNDAIQKSCAHLIEVARAEGILTEGSVYPGYAYGTTTVDQLYGKENAARLREIQRMYDPKGVMLLTGGFTI